MPTYNLGTLAVVNHQAEKLSDALGIPEYRFSDLDETARKAWEHGTTISESIEYIAQRLNGSELVLTMVLLGRIWKSTES